MFTQLQQEFGLDPTFLQNAVALLDAGNTVPFIARYRKEKTGGMDDQTLRALSERLTYLRALAARREELCRLIGEQGALTDAVAAQIAAAVTLQELEDIYRPFRPKRRTRATIAKEKGLGPLAELLMAQARTCDPMQEAQAFVSDTQGVPTAEEALAGAQDILAEAISDNAEFRKVLRRMTFQSGTLRVKAAKDAPDSVYSLYYDFEEPLQKIANHRVLAINRGEKEGLLKVSILADGTRMTEWLCRQVVKTPRSAAAGYVEEAAADAYARLMAPSLETELRSELTDRAGEAAILLFKENLHHLLLQPPIRGRVVLGFDPGYRTGCKTAVVDETGKVLDTAVVYCTLPHHDRGKAKAQMRALIEKHHVTLIAIGNGTATKESEIFVSELIGEMGSGIQYSIVNESGASVYSASPLGAAEFPQFDVALRSAVSIARRLQDPLAELVKIDPKSIGVGQYQHDMNQKRLGEALGGVVEDCVNSVGVALNTASAPLLSYVAGIGERLAQHIVAYREENGAFVRRNQLMKVPKLGPKAFEQCAGFLRIPDGDNPLDNTPVHPESYAIAKLLLSELGFGMTDVRERTPALLAALSDADLPALADKLSVGLPTLRDIADAICRPGLDPRDELPKPVLRSELLSIENLTEGMVLTGTVRNVIDFGAFVDIGVHQDGLVHVSQISNRFIRHPREVLSVGDVVQVKVIGLDLAKKRISLSMKEV